ncbi:MAG: DUF721 domain-containing protein [Sedimentisphaerales bacterium]|nr:DUF721 domain-containing protein [Sedimentisphaerales bacterium]
MGDEQLLQKANRAVNFRRAKVRKTENLAAELRVFIRKTAGPARRGATVSDAFKLAAGARLEKNCRVESFKAGVLKVSVKPGSYMFELRSRTKEITEEIAMRCPSSHIKAIKINCLEQ